jgi:hypothetical protein
LGLSAAVCAWLAWRSLGWPLIHDASIILYIGGAFHTNPPGVYLIHWAILSIGGRRIGNMNALRRQSPRPWARHGDLRCQTRTLAALGAVGTRHTGQGRTLRATLLAGAATLVVAREYVAKHFQISVAKSQVRLDMIALGPFVPRLYKDQSMVGVLVPNELEAAPRVNPK